MKIHKDWGFSAYMISGVILGFLFYLLFLFIAGASVQSEFDRIGNVFGTFGDSFGAFTALFSGLAFAGILISIKFQRDELTVTRNQFKHQHIENNFFTLLKLQQDVVNSIDLRRKCKIENTNENVIIDTKGRDCIKVIYNRVRKKYVDYKKGNYNSELELITSSYDAAWRRNQSDLGHYFRSLYSVFKYIKDKVDDNPGYYAKIVRSLLSDHELLLVYYNCLTKRGENFKIYAIQYELFDNLDVNLLLNPKHVCLIGEGNFKAFGNNSAALKEYNECFLSN